MCCERLTIRVLLLGIATPNLANQTCFLLLEALPTFSPHASSELARQCPSRKSSGNSELLLDHHWHSTSGQSQVIVRSITWTDSMRRHNLASSLPLSASSLATLRGIVQWSMWHSVRGYLDVPLHSLAWQARAEPNGESRTSPCSRCRKPITQCESNLHLRAERSRST